jgi:hypothetical protein
VSDRIERQRRNGAPRYSGLGGQVTEPGPERVLRADFIIAVGGYDEGRRAADPAAEKSQQIQGRVVGPMNILEHHHGRQWRPGQGGQGRVEQSAPVVVFEDRQHRLAEAGCHVDQRTGRTGCRQWLVPSGQGHRAHGHRVAECLDECGLTGTGFGSHEDELAYS